MPKVILISQFPLPYSQIGSWTTLYKNYLSAEHQIDYIVCAQPEYYFDNVKYSIIENDLLTKIKKRLIKNPYIGYLDALEKIMQPDEKYIIQIIDNFGIVKPLHSFLNKKGFLANSYIQFFYHGFPPYFENFYGGWFFETIDEMVLLTMDSYKVHKNTYTVLPNRFSVLHNGVDTSKFYTVSEERKFLLKEQIGDEDKIVFLWCSQDRPKKGLELLLEAWKSAFINRQDMVLWVIGCEPKAPQAGVRFLGRTANDSIPHYFQASDCYLFPTLCHEGFGMTLIEALHCGNYCIASDIGGIPEVLQQGKLGQLIANPNFTSEWVKAILDFMENPKKGPSMPNDLYTTKTWIHGINSLIKEAKIAIS